LAFVCVGGEGRKAGLATAPTKVGDLARPPHRIVPAHVENDSPGLGGQALAAFFATPCDDVAAVLRRHPLEEAVDALATAIVRLESPFHDGAPGGLQDRHGYKTPKYRQAATPRQMLLAYLRILPNFSTPVDRAVESG